MGAEYEPAPAAVPSVNLAAGGPEASVVVRVARPGSVPPSPDVLLIRVRVPARWRVVARSATDQPLPQGDADADHEGSDGQVDHESSPSRVGTITGSWKPSGAARMFSRRAISPTSIGAWGLACCQPQPRLERQSDL
jgi:hypothetical protein